VGVIGDSVARDYAYYLARELGPAGVRVVDGALSGCPVGTLQLLSKIHDVAKPLRAGTCPKLVTDKQDALLKEYAPKVIVWHSIIEIWSISAPNGEVASGSGEWARKVLAQWDETLSRITRGGARVVSSCRSGTSGPRRSGSTRPDPAWRRCATSTPGGRPVTGTKSTWWTSPRSSARRDRPAGR
jgi:hypothetical protein